MRRAIELQPGNWGLINTLGNFYFGMGQFPEAIAEYRKVVFLDPENHVTLGNLGSTNMMIGDFASARNALEQSLAIEENPVFQGNLGISYYYLGDFGNAISAFERAVELAPGFASNWIGLADARAAAGQSAQDAYTAGLERSRELLASNPEDVEALAFFAWALARLGAHEEALSAMKRAMDIDPADPYSHYYDGLVKHESGDPDGAIAALHVAIEYGYPVAMLSAEPILKELKSDTRYSEMLQEARVRGE